MAKKTIAELEAEARKAEARARELRKQAAKITKAEEAKKRAETFARLEQLASDRNMDADEYLNRIENMGKVMDAIATTAKKYGCGWNELLRYIGSDEQVGYYRRAKARGEV